MLQLLNDRFVFRSDSLGERVDRSGLDVFVRMRERFAESVDGLFAVTAINGNSAQ